MPHDTANLKNIQDMISSDANTQPMKFTDLVQEKSSSQWHKSQHESSQDKSCSLQNQGINRLIFWAPTATEFTLLLCRALWLVPTNTKPENKLSFYKTEYSCYDTCQVCTNHRIKTPLKLYKCSQHYICNVWASPNTWQTEVLYTD